MANIKDLMKKVKIIRMPSTRISTFGKTVYQYCILSSIKKTHTQFRTGSLSVKKPIIISHLRNKQMDNLHNQHPMELINKFTKNNNSEINLLGYRFQNTVRETWKEKTKIDIAAEKIIENCGKRDVIILAENKHWELGLLKLVDKIVSKSIHNNYIELMERGFFDKDRIPSTIYEEIENYFKNSKKKSDIQKLGNLLNQYNLFSRYEDRFFDLVKKIKK